MAVRVLEGHVLNVLRSLPSNTFQCVATSPPYYGLRDYGLPPQVWESSNPKRVCTCGRKDFCTSWCGTTEHEHEWGAEIRAPWANSVPGPSNNHPKNGTASHWTPKVSGQFCACGAWLGSLGLEPTPELFVEHLTSVFREVRRVLRPDGVCWVNLGDSYAGSGKGPTGWNGIQNAERRQGFAGGPDLRAKRSERPREEGCKPKDLLGMPWMVAFALRADGWYLRADIIWSKPNPMPESVTDRPTKAHEYVFLLSKSRTYFYDADAIREPYNPDSVGRYAYVLQSTAPTGRQPGGDIERKIREQGIRDPNPAGRNKRSVWEIATAPFSDWTPTVRQVLVALGDADDDTKRKLSPDCPVHADQAGQASNGQRGGRAAASEEQPRSPDSGIRHAQAPLLDCGPIDWRRGREIEASTLDSLGQLDDLAATLNSTESHRTDPAPETSPPCTPSAQTLGDTPHNGALRDSAGLADHTSGNSSEMAVSDDLPLSRTRSRIADTSSGPSSFAACTCSYYKEVTESVSHFATFPPKLVEPMLLAGSRPGDHVLDPFGGAGTTGLVADRLGRDCTLIELNPAYANMARERITDDAPMFAEVVA